MKIIFLLIFVFLIIGCDVRDTASEEYVSQSTIQEEPIEEHINMRIEAKERNKPEEIESEKKKIR